MSEVLITAISSVIVAMLSAGATIVTVVVKNKSTNKKLDEHRRAMERHNAKQSILQLILEDKVDFQDGKFPQNYVQVHDEYDTYHANGGNGVMTKKVAEYDSWYEAIEQKTLKR